jgi:glycerol-3-phosphate O-acyltransferase
MTPRVPAAPSAPARAYHAGMLEDFGPAWRLLGLPFFFRNLRMEENAAARLRAAADRGPVVYALHSRSIIDWLALNHVLRAHGLPLPVYTNGVDATPWMPLGRMWRSLASRLRGRRPADPMASGWLAETVASGQPMCVFVVPPRENVLRTAADLDALPALLDAQALTSRPIQVVPMVVVWNRRPEPARTEVGRFVLGTEDHPGVLGKLLALANGQASGDAVVQPGEPIPLDEWSERYASETPARRLKSLRLVLRRYLYREAQVVRGPRSRPYGWVRKQVLESREVRELIAREAVAAGLPADRIARKVTRTLDHVAARFSFTVVRFAAFLCRLIWNRIYSGIDVRPADLDRIRDAMRAGTPVLVPCHRSHLDYLLISSLLYEHDVVIPHVVAGENLSFWPVGVFMRRCGAFFVRRSFSGERIFPTVFARYLRELMRMEVPIEFFIEGGRSRTGKLLPPKLGVLGMLMDAAAEARDGREVTFLPIYIGYEQIAEERAYARELSGARKEKEDVRQVVKATGVLRNRYGKVYLRVGTPLRASDVFAGRRWQDLGKAHRNELLMATGERLLHRINEQAVALPTALVALAVLAHPRRGLRHEDLRARVDRLRAFLAAADVKEGLGMEHLDGIVEEAVGRFIDGRMVQTVEADHGRVYTIVAEKRVTLEYYKNSLMHAFAPAAYLAAAVRAVGPDPAAVARLFRLQQFLLRYEFVLDPDADTDALEARAARALEAYGALRNAEGVLEVADPERLDEIANLSANFLESYLLVLRAAREASGPIARKDLPRRALALGKTLLAADEVITRPEALNLSNLENAVRAFADDGVLQEEAGAGLLADPEQVDGYAAELQRLLATRPEGAR